MVYIGDTHLEIQGYGKVIIHVTTKKGKGCIELNNVACIPRFHASLVSLEILMVQNIFWDGMRKEIVRDGKSICKVERNFSQWTLEYNILNSSVNEVLDSCFTTRSDKPRREKEGSEELWHQRLGHSGSEVIQNLSANTTGAKLAKGPSTIECEDCAVSKAHLIIS